ncbi:hypothetical protein HYT57_04915 [Candidatus Woesearchaeota archaeon]|nr:hypothetical protein [Candidatus Woesearchaeota archaeon]
MVFSKAFPRQIKGSSYSVWEEISLTDSEEKAIEEAVRREHVEVMRQCINDAKTIDFSNHMQIALAFFDKRASHAVFLKESKCKEKFDALFKD